MGDTAGQAIDQPMDMSGEVAVRRPSDYQRDRPYWAWIMFEAGVPLWQNLS